MKQGEEKLHMAKEEENKTRNYIFQKNTKTKLGFVFVTAVLIFLIIAIAVLGMVF